MNNFLNWLDANWQRLALTFGIFAIAIGLGLVLMYATSSGVFRVPKAEEHELNSKIAHERSIELEKQADVLRRAFEVVERERDELKRQLDIAKSNSEREDVKTGTKRNEYEKVRKAPTVISDRDLDARERQLRTDLDGLY